MPEMQRLRIPESGTYPNAQFWTRITGFTYSRIIQRLSQLRFLAGDYLVGVLAFLTRRTFYDNFHLLLYRRQPVHH